MPPTNMAIGCTVTSVAAPNYTGSGNVLASLTDGVNVSGQLWTQTGSVGWSNVSPVMITIDLGDIRSICGFSFSTAASIGGAVYWPKAIYVLVSQDAVTWTLVGDLVAIGGTPPSGDTYHTYTFANSGIVTHGRYVQLVILSTGRFAFCDEIEVYAGDISYLTLPAGVFSSTDVLQLVTQGGVIRRITRDIAQARVDVTASTLTTGSKATLATKLDAAAMALESDTTLLPNDSSIVLPITAIHASVLAVYGPILAARGFPALFAWKKHRFDPLTIHEVPATIPSAPSIDITMLGNEIRSDAFVLTNTTEEPISATMTVSGMPGVPNPSWLRVSSVPWTDTIGDVPVAVALPDATYSGGVYHVPVPAGVSRLVWVSADSESLPSGTYMGAISVTGGPSPIVMPFSVRVSSATVASLRLSLCTFDYTNFPIYDITDANRAAAVAFMQRDVDSPWGSDVLLERPTHTWFDEDNHLIRFPSFAFLDAWVAEWPNAKRYGVFRAMTDSFAQAPRGTELFNIRIAAWADCIRDHLLTIGVPPSKLVLHLIDEPNDDTEADRTADFARAFQLSGVGFEFFSDPNYAAPETLTNQEALTLPDILCPDLDDYLAAGDATRDYYTARLSSDQTLWFYGSVGLVFPCDPHSRYRLRGWYTHAIGVTGIGHWSFGDNSGNKNSWNQYTTTTESNTPVFIGSTTITSTLWWEALREGRQDHELLAMLTDNAHQSADVAFRSVASNLIALAQAAILTPGANLGAWNNSIDRTAPDVYRQQAIATLELMQFVAERE